MFGDPRYEFGDRVGKVFVDFRKETGFLPGYRSTFLQAHPVGFVGMNRSFLGKIQQVNGLIRTLCCDKMYAAEKIE
jgi:hypothetical protein